MVTYFSILARRETYRVYDFTGNSSKSRARRRAGAGNSYAQGGNRRNSVIRTKRDELERIYLNITFAVHSLRARYHPDTKVLLHFEPRPSMKSIIVVAGDPTFPRYLFSIKARSSLSSRCSAAL